MLGSAMETSRIARYAPGPLSNAPRRLLPSVEENVTPALSWRVSRSHFGLGIEFPQLSHKCPKHTREAVNVTLPST